MVGITVSMLCRYNITTSRSIRGVGLDGRKISNGDLFKTVVVHDGTSRLD